MFSILEWIFKSNEKSPKVIKYVWREILYVIKTIFCRFFKKNHYGIVLRRAECFLLTFLFPIYLPTYQRVPADSKKEFITME